MSSIPRSIVVLTGAGVSAESGIPTFRAADGLWEEHRIEDVASPEGFARNPALVHDFYNERRRRLRQSDVRPNKGHLALAEFERKFRGEFLLVTQNIDDLHEQAGSRKLLHMHGEMLKIRCELCGAVVENREADISPASICPCCHRAGGLRPHVVWFGEMPFHMDEILTALAACDLFVSIGTSGNVHPAAGFHREAKLNGAETVELNLEPTGGNFDRSSHGPASEIVPAFFAELLAEAGRADFP
ncbi:MAG: NAD-dependent protein deacylase [Gammaproteobacteria bacterium]|nr:NAD-dependent protein deacylase [Gammaproteobacteria bacterium]